MLNNFIPEVWSARLLQNLQRALVYAQEGIVNRDYEGEIAEMGDTVRINAIGPVTIGNYTRNQNIADPETLSDAQATLIIDQAKFFNFQVDDADKAQAKPAVMDAAMREAGYGLRDTADRFVAGLHSQVATSNKLGDDTTPKVPTATTAYEMLVDLSVLLDESDVPGEGRWAVVPPWFHGLLLKDDRFVKAGTSQSDQTLRNGQMGEAAGFTILKSNNVPHTSGTKYKIMAGHRIAIAYADQVRKVEGYRPEKRFADAVKGLHLYGAKVIRPRGIAVLTANKS